MELLAAPAPKLRKAARDGVKADYAYAVLDGIDGLAAAIFAFAEQALQLFLQLPHLIALFFAPLGDEVIAADLA